MGRAKHKIRQSRRKEGGYVLIAILFAVTLLMIAVATVAPSIRTQIQREREEELIHRGKQYARAIQLYYRKFGRYPASIEQLENTNTIRFLRRKYTDPITGKDEWKLIRFGQARPKQIPSFMRGGLGGSTGTGSGQGGSTGAGGGLGGNPTNDMGTAKASDISKPLGGPTLGGGPIVGVASTSEKEGLKEIDGRSKYNEWEFTYDPTLDPMMGRGGNPTAPMQRDNRGSRPGPPVGPVSPKGP